MIEYKEIILDAQTGQITERLYDEDEIAAAEQVAVELAILQTKKQLEADTKAAAKQAIADRLGLTADELRLLLG